MKNLYESWIKISLIKRIIMGLIVGIILVLIAPEKASGITLFYYINIKSQIIVIQNFKNFLSFL